MQAVMETVFDAVYLTTAVAVGISMIRKSAGKRQYLLFGIMAVTLGLGDAFHLIPRVYALWTAGLEQNAALLGAGKFITSITMTVFYVLLYFVWRMRYRVKGEKAAAVCMFALAALRIALCLFPQNAWLSADAPLSWGIYRNIPFALMGVMVIILFFRSAQAHNDNNFRFMWLTVVLSFAFYIPVVLFADAYPLVGMLMIPKTCAYVWTIFIGYFDMKRTLSLPV